MRWIRQNVRWAARLALFALAMHLTLTFGHVHADWLAPPYAPAADVTRIDPAAPDLHWPAPPYHRSVAHDFCAICANMGLLGALILPGPSGTPTPQAFARIGSRHLSSTVPQSLSGSSFQARGPPAA